MINDVDDDFNLTEAAIEKAIFRAQTFHRPKTRE